MRQALISVCIFLLVAAIDFGGGWEEFELWLLDQRMSKVEHPASGGIAVVQIDAKTLKAIEKWPLPRDLHARLVENLRGAGADQIAFDIDLSGMRAAPENRILAEAFARAPGAIVLPLFFQKESAGDAASEIVVTRPLPMFAEHAWLANVNVKPEVDGRIRRASYGVWLDEKFYMSLPALLAGQANRKDLFFYVNYSIRAGDIPRLSYIDVLEGAFDSAALSGKKVIVGATAIELGDQLTVPNYGVMPGPVIQAMAYETIAQDLVIRRTGTAVTLAGLALICLLGCFLTKRAGWAVVLGGGLVLIIGLQAGAFVLFKNAAVGLDSIAWSFAVVFLAGNAVLSELRKQRRLIQRQKQENEYRRLLMTSVVEDSSDAIIIAGADGVVEEANPLAARIFGFNRHEAAGARLGDLLPPCLMASMDHSGAFPREFVLEHPEQRGGQEGEPICLEYSITHSFVPGDPRDRHILNRKIATYTFHDVTARHRAAQAIETAHRQEREASRAKSEFIANMSHELRTPLNAIIGFSELIARETFGALGDERYKQYALDVAASGGHLLAVVNDILDISRIDSGNVSLCEDEMDLPGAIDACVRIARSWPQAQGVSIEIEQAGPACLYADARLVKQMLNNLLSNAVKFGGKKGEAGRVLLRTAPAPDGGLDVSVADNGMGVPPEIVGRLCEPFFQANATLARTHEGTGLGLTLVRSFMELHGGQVRIDSIPGSGTCVTLAFPASRVLAPGAGGKEAKGGSINRVG